ncbi:hypothetical protein AOL_s00215g456 [Orbilia oligospora ATCC 24927]|uniref:Enoyl reductase (ER) domain-containing protein n=1 Tax=Arthrobotrys oligospora (strain ATCC 24927 / CBS 115.81 / DSM 1491) TaxID=756982 RepID=G1XSV8_ARTOA|nr:hypothetical protein AOL_s00215g456 [Orbilia oligospora ATCC 24927]EGX43720.1 hypothetical protein AOL_s00215g456 [Orbilia oligospora ATCC 24927]
MAQTMKAVVFKGPKWIAVEERPIPQIQESDDVICKVDYAGLCGSELHVYRGVEKKDVTGFIMGHEFVGTVVEVGSAVTSAKVGDKVVAPFTISCGTCFYCKNGQSSRCDKCKLFGSPVLEGSQAEYVRVPLANGTISKVAEGVPEGMYILMADIFPTGYFAVSNAIKMLPPSQAPSDATFVILGLGPVGICALVALMSFSPKQVFVIDSVESRLELAASLGAQPLNFGSYEGGIDGIKRRIQDATEGRGADAVIEIVGSSKALRFAYDLVRPWGGISSIGVHNAELPFSGAEMYAKNLKLQFGRCPVRSVYDEALSLLKNHFEKLRFLTNYHMSLSDAVAAYEKFDKAEVQKVIFRF